MQSCVDDGQMKDFTENALAGGIPARLRVIGIQAISCWTDIAASFCTSTFGDCFEASMHREKFPEKASLFLCVA